MRHPAQLFAGHFASAGSPGARWNALVSHDQGCHCRSITFEEPFLVAHLSFQNVVCGTQDLLPRRPYNPRRQKEECAKSQGYVRIVQTEVYFTTALFASL